MTKRDGNLESICEVYRYKEKISNADFCEGNG